MKKIYCRDENEINRLKEKYPHTDAEWLELPKEKKDFPAPLVCLNDEPLDECQIGEEFIEK